MDIGTRVGSITLDGKSAAGLTTVAEKVRRFAGKLEGSMGVAAGGIGVATTAVVALTGSIVRLGEEGSTILGVEDAFDKLAQSVGTTGAALSGALSEGVK